MNLNKYGIYYPEYMSIEDDHSAFWVRVGSKKLGRFILVAHIASPYARYGLSKCEMSFSSPFANTNWECICLYSQGYREWSAARKSYEASLPYLDSNLEPRLTTTRWPWGKITNQDCTTPVSLRCWHGLMPEVYLDQFNARLRRAWEKNTFLYAMEA